MTGAHPRAFAPSAWRRAAVALAVATAAGALAVTARPASAPAGPLTDRPNVILIITDDQTLTDLRARGVMPATNDLIGEKGTRFVRALDTTPKCCPSRASMLTGSYAHNHGVLSNRLGYAALEEKGNVLPVWLRDAGYFTVHIGKFLNGYESFTRQNGGEATDPAPGWDEWYTKLGKGLYYEYDLSINGERVHFGSGSRDHFTRVVNRIARRVVRQRAPASEPFFLQLGELAPHEETGGESEGRCGGLAVPERRDSDRFRERPLPTPPSFNERDVSDKPAFIRNLPRLDDGKIHALRKAYRCRLGSLRGVDRGVEAIVDTLRELGELSRTVIMVVSDNGFFLGEHRIPRKKTFAYEEGIRAPLLIRVPDRYLDGSQAAEVREPVANIDLPPTILDLADACMTPPTCRVMDGRSVLPLLEGGEWGFRRGLAIEVGGETGTKKPGLPCGYAGVHLPRRTYFEHLRLGDGGTVCQVSGERELYDLQADPFQLENLAERRRYRALRQRLAARLDRLRECAGIEGRDLPDPKSSGFCE